MRHSSMQIAFGLVLGAGAGAAIAIIAGVGGLWLTIGIALGVMIGSWMTRKDRLAFGASVNPGARASRGLRHQNTNAVET